jgi:hypothetical protein
MLSKQIISGMIAGSLLFEVFNNMNFVVFGSVSEEQLKT